MTENFYLTDSDEQCPVCGKPLRIGHTVLMDAEHRFQVMCDCKIALLDKQRKARIALGRENVRAYLKKVAGLQKRLCEQTFDTFTDRAETERACRVCRLFAARYVSGETLTGKGVMLIGGVGTGKTHLAAATANAILDSQRISDDLAERAATDESQCEKVVPDVFFSRTVSLLDRLRDDMDGKKRNQTISICKNAGLLVLDDLGTEKPSEWVRERLYDIIDHRYNDYLPVIITTNATPDELRERLGWRTYDRLREMCYLVTIQATSYRRNVK